MDYCNLGSLLRHAIHNLEITNKKVSYDNVIMWLSNREIESHIELKELLLQSDAKNKFDELTNYRLEIQNSYPTTTNERIAYMLLFEYCRNELNNIHEELVFLKDDCMEIILGMNNVGQTWIDKDACRCAICNISIAELLIAHHIIPRNSGGKNDDSNKHPLCLNCHKMMHIIERKSEIPANLVEYAIGAGIYDKLCEYTAHLTSMRHYQNLAFSNSELNDIKKQLTAWGMLA
jgi:HNH endonuclease